MKTMYPSTLHVVHLASFEHSMCHGSFMTTSTYIYIYIHIYIYIYVYNCNFTNKFHSQAFSSSAQEEAEPGNVFSTLS